MGHYVSPAVENSFRERFERVCELVRGSGIEYEKFGIFGSYARNEYTASSDIDFCLVVEEQPDPSKSSHLHWDAEEEKADVTIVTREYFEQDDSRFARNLRRDFKEVVSGSMTTGRATTRPGLIAASGARSGTGYPAARTRAVRSD